MPIFSLSYPHPLFISINLLNVDVRSVRKVEKATDFIGMHTSLIKIKLIVYMSEKREGKLIR